MPDLGIILVVVGVVIVVAAVLLWKRSSAADKEVIQQRVDNVGDTLKATVDKLIDKLHDSVPAQAAPAAAPAVPQPPVPDALVLSAGMRYESTDVPGGGTLPAGVRVATPADLAAGTPPTTGDTWPRTWVLADGTRVLAKAPLSPLYRTSQMGTIMGKPIPGGGGHAVDPANGDEATPPLPLRSPAGFPIRYSLANGVVVGTPTILHADESFNSDEEVLSYIRRNLQAAEAAEARKKSAAGAPEWTGDYDPASVWKNPGDLGYATREAMYAGRAPWLYKREQAKQLAEYGFNAENPKP